MMKQIISIAIVCLVFPALGAPLKSDGKVHAEVVDSRINITTDEGFHLNKDAPASLRVKDSKVKIQPDIKTEKRISFKIPKKGTQGFAEVYVCDDPNTVCEPQLLAVNWAVKSDSTPKVDPESKTGTISLPQNDSKAEAVDKVTLETATKKLTNDYAKAMAQAAKSKKLVFLDFTARWCPPCIRLEHEVFPTAQFKNAAKNYIIVKIDVDREENYELMKMYSVKAFPTIVIVNSEGEELERYLDYQEVKPFVASLNNLAKAKPVDLKSLKAKAEAGDLKSSFALAEYYYKSLQYDLAAQWYEKSLGMHFHESRVNQWSDEALEKTPQKTEKYQQVLREAIDAEPESFQSLDWRLALAESLGDKPESKNVLEEVISVGNLWVSDPSRIAKANARGNLTEIKGLELPEIYAKQGDAYEALGDKENYLKSYEKAVNETLKLKPTEKNPTQVIYLVAYMKPVKQLPEIEPWLVRMELAYPKEFTYPQRRAKLLFDKKQPARALPVAEHAYSMSYGNNKFTSGLLLAQIQNELKQKDAAKKLVSELLATPEAQSPRNKRVVKSMEDFLKKI